jgi:hypothetical protein
MADAAPTTANRILPRRQPIATYRQRAINREVYRARAGSVCRVLAGLDWGLSSYAVVHGGRRSAPRVIAALAGLVHDRQSATDYEYNQDNDSCYGGVHCNLPAS